MPEKNPDGSLVRPGSLPGLGCGRALYCPMDLPSRLIETRLETTAETSRSLITARLFCRKDTATLLNCIGAPMAVIGLEVLIRSGVEEILILGFCGSLSLDAEVGDALLVTSALSEEGTSKHYRPRQSIFSPSPTLLEETAGVLDARALPYSKGSIVSTDAPFRETRPWLEDKLRRRISAVDMETSAVFALSEFHGIRAAALLIVTDEVRREGWNSGFADPVLIERVRDYFFPFWD